MFPFKGNFSFAKFQKLQWIQSALEVGVTSLRDSMFLPKKRSCKIGFGECYIHMILWIFEVTYSKKYNWYLSNPIGKVSAHVHLKRTFLIVCQITVTIVCFIDWTSILNRSRQSTYFYSYIIEGIFHFHNQGKNQCWG